MQPHWTRIGNATLEVDVDLKWSLWSRCRGHWDEYAPGVVEQLDLMEPGQRLIINTAPRKEIRFGQVRVSCSFNDRKVSPTIYTATGYFQNGDFDGLEDGDPEPVTLDISVSASTPDELLAAVDRVEAALIDSNP